MEIIFILFLIFTIILIIASIIMSNKDGAFSLGAAMGVLLVIFIIGTFISWAECYGLKSPTALDVYQGKTELKIIGEYKDSIFIPTDSIVIFKQE